MRLIEREWAGLTGVHEHVFDVVLFGSEGFAAQGAGVRFLLALLHHSGGGRLLLLRAGGWHSAQAAGERRHAVGRHGHELGLLGADGLRQAEEERLVLVG